APETAESPSPGSTVAPESTAIELPPLSGESDSRPTGVNSAGRVVGTSGDRPVVWNAGTPTALDMPEGAHARESDLWINDHGTIAGTIEFAESMGAAVWEDGDVTVIDALPGHVGSRATGL